jgi:hypothetical protein
MSTPFSTSHLHRSIETIHVRQGRSSSPLPVPAVAPDTSKGGESTRNDSPDYCTSDCPRRIGIIWRLAVLLRPVIITEASRLQGGNQIFSSAGTSKTLPEKAQLTALIDASVRHTPFPAQRRPLTTGHSAHARRVEWVETNGGCSGSGCKRTLTQRAARDGPRVCTVVANVSLINHSELSGLAGLWNWALCAPHFKREGARDARRAP